MVGEGVWLGYGVLGGLGCLVGCATLANYVFWTLPGSNVRYVPLANALFLTLPGVIGDSPTLANCVF